MFVPWRVYILILHPIKKNNHSSFNLLYIFFPVFVFCRFVLDRSENTPHFRFRFPPGATNAATKHGLERQSRQVGAGDPPKFLKPMGFDIVERPFFFFFSVSEFVVVSVSGCFVLEG